MAGSKDDSGLDSLRDSEAVPAPDFAGADDAAPEPGRKPFLPQPCPVTPLGILGKNIHFLDRSNQIITTTPEVRKGELKLYFGNEWLLEHYPQFSANAKSKEDPTKFNQDDAQTALVEDCFARGVFNPEGKVFGRGAHRARADGEQLVLHIGRRVLIANAPDAKGKRDKKLQVHRAGMITIAGKDAFFPALDALPPPSDKGATKEEAQEYLDLFKKWAWLDDCAPLLLLGMVAQMYICGALEWRAHMWLPGPTASGKSTLQKIVRALQAEWCLKTADATEAGIRQILGNDTLPVSIDEAEPHDNPERLQAVLNLMKKASSGDAIFRGGADHQGKEFTARSCFLLSSVLHTNMRGEDRNRIVLLTMRKLPDNSGKLALEEERWRTSGRRFHRRMIESWPRFEVTYQAYRKAIGAQGYEGRWQDTYGTLLACADLLLYDLSPAIAEDSMIEDGQKRIDDAVASILPMLAMGRVEARTDVERIIQHITSQTLPGSGGKSPEPVGVWLERAMSQTIDTDEDGVQMIGPNPLARDKLKNHGLRVVELIDKGKGAVGIADALTDENGWKSGYLAVAYQTNRGTTEIFRDSKDWAGGAWTQSLKKIEGAIGPKKIRFAGPSSDNAVLVPLRAFRGDEG